MIVGILTAAPMVKLLYPGWYMLGHVGATAAMVGVL